MDFYRKNIIESLWLYN